MRRTMIVTALAASASMAAWSGGATAQSVGVYVGPPATYYEPYYGYAYPDYRYGPRVYGYYDRRPGGVRYYRPPEDFYTGSKRWWQQMDRHGRGGHQE